jgi:hypothetical protein
MLLLNVMLSCGPQTLAISSMDQLNEQWSMTTFVTGFDEVPSSLSESRFAGSGPFVSSPARTRRCWIRMCEAWMRIAAPRIMMPGDGAVCPAIVRRSLRIMRSAVRRMVPDTSNTQTRGPVASMQALREPAPLAFTLVTRWTVPPRPAVVSMP